MFKNLLLCPLFYPTRIPIAIILKNPETYLLLSFNFDFDILPVDFFFCPDEDLTSTNLAWVVVWLICL